MTAAVIAAAVIAAVVWLTVASALALAICRGIRIADRREQVNR